MATKVETMKGKTLRPELAAKLEVVLTSLADVLKEMHADGHEASVTGICSQRSGVLVNTMSA